MYKVFEQNGIENEGIDGAGFNNFTAGNRNGIIKGILNECQIYQPSSNSIAINTGEMVVKGARIKIIDAETQSFTSLPAVAEKWHIVAQVTMPSDRQLTASILFRQQTQLIQEDLLKNEQGTYEEIIAEFTLSTDGVTNIVKKMQVIVGGSDSNQGGSGLTEEEKAKVDKLVIDGTGDKFLADNGEYKEVEVDLTDYQKKTDESLNTESKEIVGAINEANEKTIQNETALEGKLDKYTSGGARRVYGVNRSDGSQIMIQVVDTAFIGNLVNLIPQYFDKTSTANHGAKLSDTKGVLLTNTPNQPYQCANKLYVDDALANAGGTQFYKHELIINKTATDNGFTYKKLEFVSTQSTAFSSVNEAIGDIYDNAFISLAKGYSVEEVTNDYIGYLETYFNFMYAGKMTMKCLVWGAGDSYQTEDDLINRLPFYGTIETYTPIPL